MRKTRSLGFLGFWRSCCILALIGTSFCAAGCNEFEWRCKNGQCIGEDEKCDGAMNCADGSDETVELCYGKVACQEFAFLCAYGACINGKAKCNGTKDCADGSDEFPILCNPTVSRGNCPLGYFQCENKNQCIPSEEACDGTKHCNDGSDETAKNCAFSPCPPYSFRCRYGACVKRGAECNGVDDCADGSDEVSCTYSFIRTTVRPHSTTTTASTTTTTTSNGGSCRVKVSSGMIVRPNFDMNDKLTDDDWIGQGSGVVYECEPGLYLFHHESLEPRNYCFDGKWVSLIPQCLKICERINAITYEAKYFFKFETLSNRALLRPGTRANINCAVGYVPQPSNTAERTNLKCLASGEWSPSPLPCSAVCGIIQPKHDAISTFDGSQVTKKNIPWHVGIFKKNTSSPFTNICGGNIISTKMIITAAHCLIENYRLADHAGVADHVVVADYVVVAGKYYRDYYRKEPETQEFNVSEVYVPDTYRAMHKQYSNDIGLIVLNKHIRYESHISPICYSWEPFSKWQLPAGTIGRTVGWGAIKDDVYSEELRSIELPVLSKQECLKKVTSVFVDFVNSEKFCVGSPGGGGSLCKGDSGGGFVITKTIDNSAVYYLWGIVSVSLDEQQRCHTENYITFTNIQSHRDFITTYEEKYRPDTN